MAEQKPTTHIVTKSNKPLAPLDHFRAQLVGDYQKQITNYFMGDKERAMKFMSAVVYSVQKVPGLLDCDRDSLLTAFMTCAEYEFYPSNASGEAYVLPYSGKAQFQLGYQGIVTLLYGAGNKEVIAEEVRDKDVFKISRGKISHDVDPRKTKAERGDVIGYYAIIVTPTGGSVEGYMKKEDVLAHAQKYSKSYSSKFSPWTGDNDREGWMPRKTVLKQVAKLAPKNEKLMKALEIDNEDSNIPRANLDAGGPAVGKAFHTPDQAPSPSAPADEGPTIE